jgi:NAD(P)-dependent dehydrogenase (short-subunit alcohol dehydrogenase family)
MNIIVTGASKGIGAEIVRVFSRHKTNTVIIISRNGEAIRRLAAECQKGSQDTRIVPIEFDLSQFDFYPFLLQKIEQVFKHCDILINNAGKLINRPFEKVTPQDFDDVFNINIKSPYFLIQVLMPLLGRNSHIVNISSLGGIQGTKKFAGLTAYSTSKGALTLFTEVLAEELIEKDIAVNCLALGAVQTEMFEKAFPHAKAMQTPQQIANFITDFAISGHRYFNGKVLPVGITVP